MTGSLRLRTKERCHAIVPVIVLAFNLSVRHGPTPARERSYSGLQNNRLSS